MQSFSLKFTKSLTHNTRVIMIPLLAFGLFLSGCATDISSNSYSDQHVGEAAKSYTDTGFQHLHTPPILIIKYFRKTKYLYFDDQFNRIQTLAKLNKIHSFLADLTLADEIKGIVNFIKGQNSPPPKCSSC